MVDLQLLVQQLVQGQIDLQNHIAALANAQAAPAAVACKKVVADPGTYDGSPAKFHEWWSKIKIWMQVSMQGVTDAEVAAAVYSRLTGPKAGRWAQVHLDHCMAAAHALSCTKHVWYSEHGTYYQFEFILERVMSATHVEVIPCTRTSPAYEEELMKMDYPDVRNGYGMS